MSRNPSQPLQPLAWIGLPMLLAIIATIVFATPFRLPLPFTQIDLALPEPVFPLALAFAWAVIRPSLLGPIALLLLGLFLDIFWGAPMGLWPMSLLGAYTLILLCRSLMVGQGPEILFGWYLAATGVAMAIAFLATMVSANTAPNALGVLWQSVVTILLYPVAHILIERFENADVRFK